MKLHLLTSVAALRMIPGVFMSGEVPTVVVMRDHGPVHVNKDGYDEKVDGAIFKGDGKWNADGTLRAADPVTQSAPGFTRGDEKVAKNDDGGGLIHVGNLGVLPRKKNKKERFFVIDTTNPTADIAMDGIEADGYDTNEAAWKAITEAQMNAQTRDDLSGEQTNKMGGDTKTNPDGSTEPA